MKTANGISRTCSGRLRLPVLYSETITDCYSTLRTINEELDKITTPLITDLLGIYKNLIAVNDCLDRLSTAVEKFRVCPTSGFLTFVIWAVDFYPFYSLQTTSVTPIYMQELHTHLAKTQSLTQQVADDVHDNAKEKAGLGRDPANCRKVSRRGMVSTPCVYPQPTSFTSFQVKTAVCTELVNCSVVGGEHAPFVGAYHT